MTTHSINKKAFLSCRIFIVSYFSPIHDVPVNSLDERITPTEIFDLLIYNIYILNTNLHFIFHTFHTKS